MEEWRDIKDYEGRVKSLNYNRTSREEILKPGNYRGYLYVALYKNGKKKPFLVHRLVVEAFISNINNFSEVNHKDENKSNNCVENLEWCDRKYNVNYGTRNITYCCQGKRKSAGKHPDTGEKLVWEYID